MKGASWLVAGGTVAGLVAVLSYHSEAMPASALSGAASSAPQGPSASPSASPSATAGSAKATTAPSGTAANGTATGPNVQFGYGTLAVKVTVQGGRITKVTVPSLQTAEPTSQRLSQEAIGILTPEIMSAQSLKNVDAVSGATYTSEAYGKSLQAALDKLHFR